MRMALHNVIRTFPGRCSFSCSMSVLLLGLLSSSTILNVTAQEVLQYYQFEGSMNMGRASFVDLSPSARESWETVTEQFFADYLNDVGDQLVPPLREASVDLTLISQEGLAFTFNAVVGYIAVSTAGHDPGFILLDILDSSQLFVEYVGLLRATGEPAFNSIVSLAMTADSSSPIDPPVDQPSVWVGGAPVAAPTVAPVEPPTESPVSPTASPVTPPTNSPVNPPTDAPITPPASSPTASPVTTPTQSAVIPTTSSPVATPTQSPVTPTMSPTTPPVGPQNTPTRSPSSWTSQTDPPVDDVVDSNGFQTFYVTTELLFRYTVGEMDPDTTLEIWKTATISHVSDYIRSLVDDDKLGTDFLQIRKVSQVYGGSDFGRRRQLEESQALQPLLVEFVSRLSLSQDYNAQSLVNGAFATNRRLTEYEDVLLQTLSENGDPFLETIEDIVFVSGRGGDVTTDNGGSEVSAPPKGGTGESSSSGLIVGATLAIVVVLMGLTAVVLCRQGKLRSPFQSKSTKAGGFAAASSPNMVPSPKGGTNALSWEEPDGPGVNFNKEIVVEKGMDDVSTIGDPFTVYTGAEDNKTQADKTVTTKSVTQSMLYSYLLNGKEFEGEGQPEGDAMTTGTGSLLGLGLLGKDPEALQNGVIRNESLLGEVGEEGTQQSGSLLGLGLLGGADAESKSADNNNHRTEKKSDWTSF